MEIELVATIEGGAAAAALFADVWGDRATPGGELLFVIALRGGYVALAEADDQVIGASFGILADGGRSLHSHMTAVLPSAKSRGLGFALKQHQRCWAREHGLEAITWTFDPLVRRNAWFNLAKLGARVTDYHVNHYGTLGDRINGDDETDRLSVTWSVADQAGPGPIVPGPAAALIETPPDIESLRASRAPAARTWRPALRERFLAALAEGRTVTGITAGGAYVMELER